MRSHHAYQQTTGAGGAGRTPGVDRADLLALPALLVAVDITALFLALPRLSADLHATSVEQLWITDSYGFLVAGFVITMGTLGDRVGHRQLLLIGGAAFAAVSVAAAYSVSPLMLIIARGVLGIAGATLAPSTLALISSMFRDARQRGQAIAVWAHLPVRRRGGLPGAGPGAAAALLVGLGVPDGSAGHDAAGGRRAVRAAGVPQPRPRPSGPGQRRAVAGGGAAGGVRAQAGGGRRVELPGRAGRSPRASRSAWSSCGASSGSTRRC